jgi:hypothetical protein
MQSGTFAKLELVDENVDKFGEPLTSISSASQWFIAKFPGLAKVWGAPFIENRVVSVDGFTSSTSLAPNPSFMAAVLGYDEIENSVVYNQGDCQFYYLEPNDQKYYAVQDQKLGCLIRGYFQRCALDLQRECNVYHLFTTFCQDAVIKTIVDRAKTVLLCADDYFSVDSVCSRVKGIELHERLAKLFVEGWVVKPGSVLLVGVAYEKYAGLVKLNGLEPVKRSVFKELMKPLVREKFNICLRNDLVVWERYSQGWKDLSLVG